MAQHDTRTIAEELHQEHVELGREVSKLESVLAGEFDWPEIADLLDSLEARIHSHFDFEEEGGYLEELLRLAPRVDSEVRKLREEHDTLRTDIGKAVEWARRKHDRPGLREHVTVWLSLLGHHEASENRLVQVVFNTEAHVLPRFNQTKFQTGWNRREL